MPTTRGRRSQDGVTNLERTDYVNNGVVEGGKLFEEGNLLGYGRSRGHGGDRAACRSAGGASERKRAASTGGRPGKGDGSEGLHANSGRTGSTGSSPGKDARSQGQFAATRR